MMLLGLDDTDIVDSPGTNQLCRHLAEQLADVMETVRIVRHQLLDDDRIPYTSRNGSASIWIRPRGSLAELARQNASGEEVAAALAAKLVPLILKWCPVGSDPGLCITPCAPEEIAPAIRAFGVECQQRIVRQDDAFDLAESHGIFLRALGGTGGGVIGALAAVGLAAPGNDGRIVYSADERRPALEPGWHRCETLWASGVQEIRATSGETVFDGSIDIGKKLRPNLVAGRVVLFVEPAGDHPAAVPAWRALKCL